MLGVLGSRGAPGCCAALPALPGLGRETSPLTTKQSSQDPPSVTSPAPRSRTGQDRGHRKAPEPSCTSGCSLQPARGTDVPGKQGWQPRGHPGRVTLCPWPWLGHKPCIWRGWALWGCRDTAGVPVPLTESAQTQLGAGSLQLRGQPSCFQPRACPAHLDHIHNAASLHAPSQPETGTLAAGASSWELVLQELEIRPRWCWAQAGRG